MVALIVGLLLQVPTAAGLYNVHSVTQSGPPQGAPGAVRAKVTLSKDTVTVAEHFTATVKLRAPRGSTFDIPAGLDTVNVAGMDTAGPFERFDADTADGYSDVTAIYTLAAWDLGRQRLGLDSIVVHLPNGGDTTVQLDRVDSTVIRTAAGDSVVRTPGLTIFVRPTMTERNQQKIRPKPPRDLLAEPAEILRRKKQQQKTYAGLVIGGLVAAFLGWVAYRRYRQSQIPVPVPDPVEQEFQRIEAMRLVERGETEQHAMLMAGVLRNYLIRHHTIVRESATTYELQRILPKTPLIPAEQTLALLGRVDLLKFAHARATADEANAMGTESRAIVREVMAREQAAREEEERARAELAQQQAAAKSSKTKPKTRKAA